MLPGIAQGCPQNLGGGAAEFAFWQNDLLRHEGCDVAPQPRAQFIIIPACMY